MIVSENFLVILCHNGHNKYLKITLCKPNISGDKKSSEEKLVRQYFGFTST